MGQGSMGPGARGHQLTLIYTRRGVWEMGEGYSVQDVSAPWIGRGWVRIAQGGGEGENWIAGAGTGEVLFKVS
jgi:hypothetical protein